MVYVAVLVDTVGRTVPSLAHPAPPSVHPEPLGPPAMGHARGEVRPPAQVMACARMVYPERVLALATLATGVQLAQTPALLALVPVLAQDAAHVTVQLDFANVTPGLEGRAVSWYAQVVQVPCAVVMECALPALPLVSVLTVM